MLKRARHLVDLFPGVWHHGDFVRLEKVTGGLTMLGRSDGILKPSGVRFGSAGPIAVWFGARNESR